MIRFRNPSSSLETMLASFDKLYEGLKEKYYFDNDDIARVLTNTNLMASSGFTGETALSRGANKDRSRDKTYNNAKMFAETFRLLGLLSTVNGVSSNYRVTFIGQHMAAPGADRKSLLEQCVLGINNPNRIIDVSYDESVRFFSCVLMTMNDLDGYLCRDEMILGPMCVNDNSPEEYAEMIHYLKNLRGDYKKLKGELERLARSLKGNKSDGMSVTSVQNCTRFPISVLNYCKWVQGKNLNVYGKSMKFMVLTDNGREIIGKLKPLCDIRLSDYENSTEEQQKALIRLGAYSMLDRANFDLSGVSQLMEEDSLKCEDILRERDILFSPYQTLEYETVNEALYIREDPIEYGSSAGEVQENSFYAESGKIFSPYDIEINTNVSVDRNSINRHIVEYVDQVKALYGENHDIDAVVEDIAYSHIHDKKEQFYPFVETLFRVIGVDCHKSRDGVIGERWDAMIRDPNRSIPIEIKSPTEEMHLSVKAIRQALENKIVLLSRGTYITTTECPSYAVGYFLPNERAEVYDLIENIRKTFDYKIAVFDIATLIRITVNIILQEKGINKDILFELEGIVNVKGI